LKSSSTISHSITGAPVAVDPADLVLARRPVASDRMDVAVDQARRDGGAVGINNGGGALGVDVLEAADRRDPAVLGHDRVGIQDRLFQRPRQQQPDIADHQLAGTGRLGCVVRHGFSFWFNAFAAHSARLDDRIKLDYSFVYE
jgi:hypothetical protein